MADTDDLRKEVFRLRYDVYCRELASGKIQAIFQMNWRKTFMTVSRGIVSDAQAYRLLYAGTGAHGAHASIPICSHLFRVVDHCAGKLFDGPLTPGPPFRSAVTAKSPGWHYAA